MLRRPDGWWWMWYVCQDERGRRVHMARSVDGRAWHYRRMAVDLGEPGSADADGVDCPSVVATSDGTLVMAYGAGTSRSLAAAVSRDGVIWRKLGPILHRRLVGPDTGRVWYPAWLPTGSDVAELLYAGQDAHACWTILTAGQVALPLLAARPSPLPLTAAADAALTHIRAAVTDDYLVEPDYHRPPPVYRSPDGRVEQLRPSTSPVFTFRDGPGQPAGVVKLGRDRASAEREFSGQQALARYYPIPTATLHYQQGQAALVMEYLDGIPLAGLARTDPARFEAILADVAARLATTAGATLVPTQHLDGPPDHTEEAPAVLAGWAAELTARLRPWSRHRLTLDGEPLPFTLAGLLDLTHGRLAQPPTWVVHASGDPHLNNVHVARHGQRWWLLDCEYAGLHDLEYLLAKLLTSCFKHTGLLTATATTRHQSLHLDARIEHPVGQRLLTTPWLLGPFARLPTDRQRLAAHLLPLLNFRFTSYGDGPPAFGLTALVLAARLILNQQ
ncbi:phosphotransferase [Plantactinospora sp. ZYX-F-223]|uniref:phosphotransferase n=1 Tax=Plantactinospora sp. ZYX-F-223 TaxID=3144103 RepID=UPI0031FC8585